MNKVLKREDSFNAFLFTICHGEFRNCGVDNTFFSSVIYPCIYSRLIKTDLKITDVVFKANLPLKKRSMPDLQRYHSPRTN